MSDFICHDCGVSASPTYSASPANLFGTKCQHDKFEKHTNPSTLTAGSNLHSIFFDPSRGNYESLVANAYALGCFEIDNRGTSILWYSGSDIGMTYQYRMPLHLADTVKVVRPDDPSRTHAFPAASAAQLQGESCCVCGCPVVQWPT